MTDNETKDAAPTEEEENLPVTAEAPADVPAAEEGGEDEFKFVEEPAFEIDHKGDCLYEVKVSIPPANERKLAADTFDELQHEAELPGFRRGRVPRKLIERKFAKVVRNDVEGKLVKAAVVKLIKEKDLKPTGVPEVVDYEKNDHRQADDPIAFTLKFEVGPRVDLCKYRGVSVERPLYIVQDKDTEDAIKTLQSRYSVFDAVEGAEAADGDQAIISFKGLIDGAEFPGGAAENYPDILGSKRFFPEFEEVLIGAKSGDTRTCHVTFPDSYPAEHLRGRTAQFEIALN
ncbi:MAG: trigger factor [Candidatus Hydrogenedentes bacterium]|nr:trigger factor [Candidatus Hydrogenedentota bacterium]